MEEGEAYGLDEKEEEEFYFVFFFIYFYISKNIILICRILVKTAIYFLKNRL